jgi:hypothetical protein
MERLLLLHKMMLRNAPSNDQITMYLQHAASAHHFHVVLLPKMSLTHITLNLLSPSVFDVLRCVFPLMSYVKREASLKCRIAVEVFTKFETWKIWRTWHNAKPPTDDVVVSTC